MHFLSFLLYGKKKRERKREGKGKKKTGKGVKWEEEGREKPRLALDTCLDQPYTATPHFKNAISPFFHRLIKEAGTDFKDFENINQFYNLKQREIALIRQRGPR